MPDFFKPKKQILKTPEQAYSELLGGSTENQVVEIDISLIDEIDDQPQSIHQDKIENIAESMKHIGQIDPVTVVKSKKEGRYVLLAGRHRKRACLLNGQKSVKAIIKNETDPDKQRLILLATNNDRNTDYLPSELAFSYAEQSELLKKLGSKSTVSAIAEQNNTNRKAVHRHIRLTYLIKPLFNKVDSGAITVGAGYELSFLSEEQQISLLNFILNNASVCQKIDKDIARRIRLEPDNLQEIFYQKVDVPVLFEEADIEEENIEIEPLEAEKEKVNNSSEKVINPEPSNRKCPTVGHLNEKEQLPNELIMTLSATVLNCTSSVLKYYATAFPTTAESVNMFSQRFKNFSASGNTQNYVPYQEYQNCEYKLKFLKKQLEFYLNNNKYTVAYNELDEFIRRYLRKFFPKEKLVELISNT